MNKRPFRHRRRAESQFEHIYRTFRFPREPGEICDPCFYCGEVADTIDHCPPISKIDAYRMIGLEREEYLRVKCCRECNALLGDSLQDDILDRERHLKGRMERKYRRHLSFGDWTPEELAGVGSSLRKMLRGSSKLRRVIEDRLDFSRGIDAWLDSIEIDEAA